MTLVRVRLTGPSKKNVPIVVQLIGPAATNTAHGTDGEVLSEVDRQKTDSNGLATLSLIPTDTLQPGGCFYRVTALTTRRATWNIYLTTANAPSAGEPYDVGNTALQVVTPTPPDWVPVATIVDPVLVVPILDQYFIDNPIDVAAAVAAALAADPPLLVSENGSDVDDDAAFREAIGAAPSTVVADLATERNRIDALELNESTDPAVRLSMVTESSGVITFDLP